jgi:hypothetical protein
MKLQAIKKPLAIRGAFKVLKIPKRSNKPETWGLINHNIFIDTIKPRAPGPLKVCLLEARMLKVLKILELLILVLKLLTTILKSLRDWF